MIIIILLSLVFTNVQAQESYNLEDPKEYTLALWNAFFQKEGLTSQVENTISKALEILRNTDKAHETHYFNSTLNIIISKTPTDHLTQEGFALSFTTFLEEDAPFVVATHVAYLFAQQHKTPQEASHWVKTYFDIKPQELSWNAQTDYVEKLRNKHSFHLEDFIGVKDLKNYTLRFRVLTDQEGLMVPIEKETGLAHLLEGNIDDYTIEEIPLTRLLNQIQLQIMGSLIKDIKFSEMDNDRVMMIGQCLTTFLVWTMIDRRLALIKKGWLRKTSRFLTFIGGFFVIDGAIEKTVQASGYNINEENLTQRDHYENVLLFLTESLESAKLGTLNIETFKKEFCLNLGINNEVANHIHLLDDEQEWVSSIEGKIESYYAKKTDALKVYLEKTEEWLERLQGAQKKTDPNTGLTFYEIPQRRTSQLETASDTVFTGGAILMVGELAYTKIYKLKRFLYSGRIFGGVALSALTINYLLGVSAQEPITLPEDEKLKLETELKALHIRLPQLISTYELLQKDPSNPF